MDPIIGDLLELMPDTITIQRTVQSDGKGARTTAGSAQPYRCRMVGQVTTIRTQGKTIKSSMHAVVAGTGFQQEDIVRLPSRFSPNSPPILHIGKSTDENGAHHETIYF